MVVPRSVLLVRRDNIGDLVCTTPAIRALRQSHPDSRIDLLVNSYNAEVVANNPDIDNIYIYKKAKHLRESDRYKVWLDNMRLIRSIRKVGYDVAVACSNSYSKMAARYALLSGAKKRIGYLPKGESSVCYNLAVDEVSCPVHEVVSAFRLLSPLGIDGEPPLMVVKPSDPEVKRMEAHLKSSGAGRRPLLAMHVSSRKPANRWPKERFSILARELVMKYGFDVALLWSPGEKDNPRHPGDDEEAKWISGAGGDGVYPCPTESLGALIAILSLATVVVCCDGGAMHIAAALGKPIVAIWGSTDRRVWAPWGVPHTILQNGSNADSVTTEEVLKAFDAIYLTILPGRQGR